MANYDKIMVCPACGMRDLNLQEYVSLMVLKPRVGLFTLQCPSCQAKVSSIQPIPPELEPVITQAAQKLNAGMGHDLSR